MRKPLRYILSLLMIAVISGSACILPLKVDEPVIPSGNTLRLFDSGPITLDPAVAQEVGSQVYVVHIFSGLITLNADMEPVGDIAEKWDVDEGGTVYTFHLRKDAAFHDGTPITAHDFVYSWERACTPGTRSPTAATYLNDIVGVQEMISGDSSSIEGVKVIDDYTLKVTIGAPKAYFLSKLTYPVAFVVDRSNVESGKEWWRQPNGSGPFQLSEWHEGELILLEKNAHFYGAPPKLDHVAFVLSGGTPMQLYERGQIDVAYVSLGDLDRVSDTRNPLHNQLQVSPELSVTYIGFDTTRPPFDDLRVRRALCQAFDRQSMISGLLKNAVLPARSVVPPGMPGAQEITECGYDLKQALTLLGEAGYRNGTGLSVALTMGGTGGYLPSWLSAMLWAWKSTLDIDLQVRQLEPESFAYELRREKDELFLYGWVADYPDPQNFLEVLFHSKSPNNTGGYSNPAFDSLLDEAAVEQDYDARMDLYQQAERLLLQDVACIPLWFNRNYILVKPNVIDFSLSPMGIPQLTDAFIAG